MTDDIRPGCLPDCIEFGFTLPCPKCDQRKTAMVNEARAALKTSMNAQPAQMTYDGALVPINSTGMRYVIDDATALREELRKARARPQLFPIQSARGAKPHPLQIPWSVAELAYSVYSARYGRGQSLERLAERGGFGPGEMDMFYPEWREACSEITRLETELRKAREEAQRLAGEARALSNLAAGCSHCWPLAKDMREALDAHGEREAAGKSEGAQAITTITLCHVCGQTEAICRAAALHAFDPVKVQQ